jgi:hypothetical protein
MRDQKVKMKCLWCLLCVIAIVASAPQVQLTEWLDRFIESLRNTDNIKETLSTFINESRLGFGK